MENASVAVGLIKSSLLTARWKSIQISFIARWGYTEENGLFSNKIPGVSVPISACCPHFQPSFADRRSVQTLKERIQTS